MKKIIYLLFIAALSVFASCDVEKLLDKQDVDPNTPEMVFSDKTKVRQALTHLYGSMWFAGSQGVDPITDQGCAVMDIATDNAISPAVGDTAIKFTRSTLTPDQNPFYYNPWTVYYRGIRSANLFMANIYTSPLTDQEKELMYNEARLLRAIYYHDLMRFYGALVIIGDEIVDPMTTALVRSSMQATIDYIVGEYDAVIAENVLPQVRWTDNIDYGRMTLGVAYAYKARTLLYAASPLNADQNDHTWAEAAAAAKELIAKGWYALHADATKPELSFARFFNERTSPEQILTFLRGATNGLYKNLPSGSPWNNTTAWPGTAVTMNGVDAFAMKSGVAPILGYNPDGTPIINPLATGYNDATPFVGRDPRLDQTVLHHGSTWVLNGVTVTMDITRHTMGLVGKTNLCMRKFLDDRTDHIKGQSTQQNLPMMRYAEVLLNYVEARNESLAAPSQADIDEMIGYMNDIRTRAGADLLSPSAAWTQQSLRAQIRLERRMEFMLEGHRFYDSRRWLEAEKDFNGAIYGYDIVNGRFTRKLITNRIFLKRLYRLPIPTRDAVGSGGGIWQNEGW